MKLRLFSAARSWIWLVGFLLVAIAIQAHAQGCSQCLDSTRATPPAVQDGYRHAIYVLGGAGLALFLCGVWLVSRER